MDINSFTSVTIPQRDTLSPELAKRCDASRAVAILRTSEEEFLVCYDGPCYQYLTLVSPDKLLPEFGFFVSRHGDAFPDRPVIEWEAKAERIIWLSPCVVIFSKRFVEVRCVETARLVQIIHGDDVHVAWDGRGMLPASALPEEGWALQEVSSLDRRIHVVMRTSSPVSTSLRADKDITLGAQHLFELVPASPPSAQL